MTEEIYGDVLFIINFSMDFLSLYITGSILKTRMKTWRMLLSASFGGVYGVLALFFPFGGALLVAVNIVCAAVMCFIAFYRKKGLGTTIKSTLLFYATGMLLGGIMTAVYSKLGKYTGYVSLGGSLATVFGNIPIWLFAVLAAVSAIATYVVGKIISRKSAQETSSVTIGFSGRQRQIECLVDSGNLVCEPITGTPVIFVKPSVAGIIPEKLLACMKNGGVTDNLDIMKKLRFIPSSSVTGGATLIAAAPDICYVESRGNPEPKKALVAVDYSGCAFGGRDGLVPKILL